MCQKIARQVGIMFETNTLARYKNNHYLYTTFADCNTKWNVAVSHLFFKSYLSEDSKSKLNMRYRVSRNELRQPDFAIKVFESKFSFSHKTLHHFKA